MTTPTTPASPASPTHTSTTSPVDYSRTRDTLAQLDPAVKIAVVTGASSGIGAATARALAAEGFHVVVGARRVERITTIAREINGTAIALDVTDPASVASLVDVLPRLHLLVNNAGGAKGLTSVVDADITQWRWMWETNVLGTLHTLRATLPLLVASGDGVVITITSTAALEAYDNGSGYTSAKAAQSKLHNTLRGEFLGQPVRFTEILPGLVETEFSLVRFDGDAAAAAKPYAGMEPMVAEDIAEIVAFVASRPPHVNVDRIVVRPREQHSAMRVHRR